MVDNAALVFNRSGTTTIANAISGSGTRTSFRRLTAAGRVLLGWPWILPDVDSYFDLIVTTGPCFIKLWMGDTLYDKDTLNPFYKDNVCTPGTYIGIIGCGKYGPGGTEEGSLPAIPTITHANIPLRRPCSCPA